MMSKDNQHVASLKAARTKLIVRRRDQAASIAATDRYFEEPAALLQVLQGQIEAIDRAVAHEEDLQQSADEHQSLRSV